MWILQFPADLVIFTEEILNGKLHFFAVYILLEVIVVVNVFQLCFAIGLSFQCNIFFMVLSINKRKLPTNNQSLEKDL